VGAYTAAKGGVKQAHQVHGSGVGEANIQSNGIGPGYILTEMNRPVNRRPEVRRLGARPHPGPARWADPTELVGTAVFLASRASDFVNGQIIYVDGGDPWPAFVMVPAV